MRRLRFIFDLVTWLVLGVILIMVLYIVTSNVNIFFGYRSFVVQSGSMEPAIMTGDIIVVHGEDTYTKNDVVTFLNNDGRIVTHRIVDTSENDNKMEYTTKGDANRSEDSDVIGSEQVIGKVFLIIPKLGFLVAFSKSLPGLITLILIPAIIFIVDELTKKNR